MNIQKTNNVNFEARRILNVRQSVKNGADKVVDIFVLEKEDKNFIARCNAALDADNRVVVKTCNNVKGSVATADKSFRDFFKSFLRCVAGKGDYGLEFSEETYLIALKDGETIAGVAEARDYFHPISRIERLIFKENDTATKNGLMYGVIDALKNKSSMTIIGMSDLLPKKQDNALSNKAFNSALSSLKKATPDAEFEKVSDMNQYDLEDFLGVKDIETEIMY